MVFLFSEISLTQCQKQLQEAINLPSDPERFVPRCKFDGGYEEVQCQNSTGLCWCVDQDGNEMSSTATNGTVTCLNIGEIFLGICVFVFLTVLLYKCKLLGGGGKVMFRIVLCRHSLTLLDSLSKKREKQTRWVSCSMVQI